MDDGAHFREEPVTGIDAVGEALVVRLAGDLDLYNVEVVRAGLASAIDRAPARLVVDLSAVEFLDSTALGALVDAHRRQPGGLCIAGPRAPIRRALRVSGIDRHLTVFASVDDALAP